MVTIYRMLIGGTLLFLGAGSQAAEEFIPGSFFLQGNEEQSRAVSLPVSIATRIRLFDRQIAYRNDNKACVTFELPARGRAASSITLALQAYNDDRRYLRAVWFEVDGIGGYLAVHNVAPVQHRGNGTIAPGQQKAWQLPLDRFPVSLKGAESAEVNFQKMLQAPGSHTLCSWISTYREYAGPDHGGRTLAICCRKTGLAARRQDKRSTSMDPPPLKPGLPAKRGRTCLL